MMEKADLLVVFGCSCFIALLLWFWHLWRLMIVEERFEKRYDEAAAYWQAENNKLHRLETLAKELLLVRQWSSDDGDYVYWVGHDLFCQFEEALASAATTEPTGEKP